MLHPHLKCDALHDLIPWNELHSGFEGTLLHDCKPMPVMKIGLDQLGDWWDQLLLDVASDLAHAMQPLRVLLQDAALRTVDVADRLDELFDALPLDKSHHDLQRFREGIELFSDLLDRSQVLATYPLEDVELDFLSSRRMILAVPSWEEDPLFPRFQFVGPTEATLSHPDFPMLRGDVVEVLRNTPLSFGGWKACLWFGANGLADAVGYQVNGQGGTPVVRNGSRREKNNLNFWRTKLGEIGLWLPYWKMEADGLFDEYWPQSTQKPDGKTLYRVTETRHSPFWYGFSPSPAQYEALVRTNRSVQARKRELEPVKPGGRFDPQRPDDEDAKVGAIYFSEQAEGCWAEVFDREPAIFLDDVLQRRHWECRVTKSTVDLVDFTGLPVAISATAHRAESQSLTRRLLDENKAGLRYSLRSRVGSVGVVLFGAPGVQPAVNGLDLAQGHPEPRDVGDDPASWKALHDISSERKGRTIRFRRFPGSTAHGLLPT
ncbi:MAG: RES family NAD+ phosphorylase [Acidobacteriota bacterium]|nr:RES family NAD+ phosphorylase [Acidobacteriota bacterium]